MPPTLEPRFAEDRAGIQDYLAFGFVPRRPPDEEPLALLREWGREPRRHRPGVSEDQLVREGVRALREAFERCASRSPAGGDQVVLLSGGLDSRTILGALLDLYGPSQVVAATFGMPGEQDYDFAAQVARRAGVRHERLESFSAPWSTSALVESVLARRVPLPYPFGQRYLSYVLHERIGRENVFWDGLCGDAVSGDWAPGEDEHWTWEAAVEEFYREHRITGSDLVLDPGLDPRASMPTAPVLDPSLLSFPDQLDLGVRQQRYTGTRILSGYTVHTPFLAGPWLDLMLGIPVRLRHKQHLYMEIQRQAYPRLFSLPTTTFDGQSMMTSPLARRARRLGRRLRDRAVRLGLPLRPDAPTGANDALRRFDRPPLRDILVENLDDLRLRGVLHERAEGVLWDAREGRLGTAMTSVLLGLELNLKAGERDEPAVGDLRSAVGGAEGSALGSVPVAPEGGQSTT